eukprot:scaffold8110_cov403-Prasinococcus_capsulatus_cf.AAC.9
MCIHKQPSTHPCQIDALYTVTRVDVVARVCSWANGSRGKVGAGCRKRSHQMHRYELSHTQPAEGPLSPL